MGDGLQVVLWAGLLAAGLAGGVALRRLGLAATHVRDLLHVGAGLWVFGWPAWRSWAPPAALAAASAAILAAAPRLARAWPPLERVVESIAGDGEGWGPVTLYGIAFTGLTVLGLAAGAAYPAAGALLALALGDGVGGAVGRRFGRRRYAAPGGTWKTLEGSAAVALLAAAGALAAALRLGEPVSALAAAGTGAVAALAEAFSPRGTDNLLVPAAVYAFLAFAA